MSSSKKITIRPRIVSVYLLICSLLSLALSSLAASPEKPLNELKEEGRKKSLILNAPAKKKLSKLVIPKANLKDFQTLISPIIRKNCVDCHGPKKAKGKFRIDTLNPDLLHGPNIKSWVEVYEVLANQEMPPFDQDDYHLSDKDANTVVDWLAEEMNKATLVRKDESASTSFRRLTRYEFNYALQDLLGLPYNFSTELPPESTSEDGFKNSSSLLKMSAMQFGLYRAIALKALNKAAYLEKQPETVSYQIPMQRMLKLAQKLKQGKVDANAKQYKKQRTRTHFLDIKSGKGFQQNWGYDHAKWALHPDKNLKKKTDKATAVAVLPSNQELKLEVGNFLPDRGKLRVRIRAWRSNKNPKEHASLRLIYGGQSSNNANYQAEVSLRDLEVKGSVDKPQWIEFELALSEIPRNPFLRTEKLGSKAPNPSEVLTIRSVSNANSRAKNPLTIQIDQVEITTMSGQQWPPISHQAIFSIAKGKMDENTHSKKLLQRFMGLAWRRPVSSQELERYAAHFRKIRPQFKQYEQALIETLANVLSSPNFLYITTQSENDHGQLSQMALANRLSFFLWSSIPDGKLLKLAYQKKLDQPQVLKAQIDRMLADPRAKRFEKHFVDQWLGLDGIHSVVFDKKYLRNYNDELKRAMLEEPRQFFSEMLHNNLSFINFIHSDFLMLNQRLAEHYGIKGVYGPQFRRVNRKLDSNRSGILTSAAVMAINSDGKDSHPLKRGIWMLEHILNNPPPPPPPNVPEVDLTDPEILKMTLKERMENHRSQPACYSCHAKIDPWGIAFENFDALGSFRTKIKGKPVDANTQLFNKKPLKGIDGLKRHLLSERQDQFSKAFVHKLLSYALGRTLSFGDKSEIDKLTLSARKNQDRLKDLVKQLILSDIFHKKAVDKKGEI